MKWMEMEWVEMDWIDDVLDENGLAGDEKDNNRLMEIDRMEIQYAKDGIRLDGNTMHCIVIC